MVEIETELLAKSGHDVRLLTVDNREEIANGLGALRAGLRARRNPRTRARLRRFLADGPLDVAHVHNFFPILSPALHEALHEAGVPVVAGTTGLPREKARSARRPGPGTRCDTAAIGAPACRPPCGRR